MKVRLTPEGKDYLPDLFKFAKHLKRSEDIDPIYPVLRELHSAVEADDPYGTEVQLWHSFLYVAWYNLPVSHAAWKLHPEPRDPKVYGKRMRKLAHHWPTGIERRSNRGGKVFQHIEAFCQVTDHTSLAEWFRNGFIEAPTLAKREANWRMLNERLKAVWGNGRWAAYKHCEVLRRVHDLPVEAPDMGHRFSSGPRKGLATLYGPVEGQNEAAIAVLDAQGRHLQERLAQMGLELDVEELETVLCNWKSLLAGRYYVGHDIDEMQEQIEVAHERGILTDEGREELYAARELALPHHYLGEFPGNDWEGVQKKRMMKFRDHNRVVVRKARR